MDTISNKQKEWLHSLKCMRMSETDDISFSDFTNTQNDELQQHYCEHAYEADTNNESAYYIITTSDNKVLFYFSLRCGLLFEKVISEELQNLCYAFLEYKPKTVEMNEKLKYFQLTNNFSDHEMSTYFNELYSKIRYQKKSLRENTRIGESNGVELVPQSLPAIELSHFCKNEDNKAYSEYLFPNHKLGEIIFWYFVLPVVQNVLKLIGGQYVYLFAVASDENQSLVNYYNTLLKFDKEPILGTYKPTYAQSCKFMCLSIKKALDIKKRISEHFNEHWGTL